MKPPFTAVFDFLALKKREQPMKTSLFLDNLAASTEMAVASKVAIGGGAAGAMIFGANAQVVGIIGGLAIGIGGLCYNIWATERTERRRSRMRDDH
jgi:uncharacterized membrane protein YebE (DUF533 family)